MRWGHVVFVPRRAAMALVNRVYSRAAGNTALSGPAEITPPKSKPNGARPSVDLTARAVRLSNRNKAQTARYLAVHRALSKGR